MDCGRETKDTKRGRQGSCRIEAKMGERGRVRQGDYQVRREDMKGLGSFHSEKAKVKEGVVR